ncbi:hypothetical protein QEN19_002803 [Hanseniaspora menglaensis]
MKTQKAMVLEKKDIANENLFFIKVNSLKIDPLNISKKELSLYNGTRQPDDCITIDSLIDGVKSGNIDISNVNNISFVKPFSRPDGMCYTKKFKEQLENIKRNQILKDVYKKDIENDESTNQQSIQEIHKEIKEQLTTIFNIFITVISCVVACWYWTPYVNIHYRLFLCIFVGILVLIADVVVYNSFQKNIKNSELEKKKKK